jgi:hypothetical protein
MAGKRRLPVSNRRASPARRSASSDPGARWSGARIGCNAPRDIRTAYESTLPFLEWEISRPKKIVSTAFDGVEHLLDSHALELRKLGWKMHHGQRVVTRRRVAGTLLAVGTLCRGRVTRTVLGVASEFEGW